MKELQQERELLESLIQNDSKSISLIYKDNYPMIQSLVLNNNGDIDEAKDIFQESLIVLFEKAKNTEFELNCKISTYLYSVAKRLWLKRLQSASYKGVAADYLEETIAVEEDVDFHETKNKQFEMMHDALLKIGEPCKSLLEAYYFNKQQMQEISSLFGYTNADNAKNQKYKCLMRLKKLFFAQHKNL